MENGKGLLKRDVQNNFACLGSLSHNGTSLISGLAWLTCCENHFANSGAFSLPGV
jgi:hypothetical protein